LRSISPDTGELTEHRRRRRDRRVQANPRRPAGPPKEPSMPATEPISYLRTAQVADLLHVSPKTVSRWAKEGKLPFLKTLGGHRRYPEAKIRELVATLREEPTG
jgi:excisionase family DNA binding protein